MEHSRGTTYHSYTAAILIFPAFFQLLNQAAEVSKENSVAFTGLFQVYIEK